MVKKLVLSVLSGLTLMVAISAPLAVSAQADDLCGLENNPEKLRETVMGMLGPWQVEHLSGFVTVGGMTMPFPPANEVETINLERRGTDLIATHPDMQEPMVFKLTNEPVWSFLGGDEARGIPAPAITSEDLRALAGCEPDEMPRMIGTTKFNVEGMTMDFTWRVTILDPETMFVVQHIEGVGQGYPYYSRRSVLMHR